MRSAAAELQRMQQLTATMAEQIARSVPELLSDVVAQQLAAAVVPAVEHGVALALSPLRQSFGDAIASQASGVSSAMLSQLNSQLPGVLSASVERAAAQLRAPIMSAFTATFEDSVVPGFERACQAMYNDLNESFASGSGAAAAGGAGVAASSAQLSAVATQLQQTSAQLARSAAAFAGGAGGATPVDPATALETSILALAKEGQYNRAFETAVSSNDVALLTTLCESVDSGAIFVSPSPITNVVRLCILQQVRRRCVLCTAPRAAPRRDALQPLPRSHRPRLLLRCTPVPAALQLASDLTTSTITKVAWMQQLVLSLDRNDPQIAEHIGGIMEHVMASLVANKAAIDATGDGATITNVMVLSQVLGHLVVQTRTSSSP